MTNVQTPSALPEAGVPLAPDLTQRAPRSPRVRLGGYAILPRTLDKGRAAIAGSLGEYHFGCPLDQQFLAFVGIEADELREQLVKGATDSAVLAWVQQHARTPRTPAEIAGWCVYQELREPGTPEMRAYFEEVRAKVAPQRSDIRSWFELLDVDDYVSFGGRS